MRTLAQTAADPRRQGETGLTLVEIIVVLAIIAVISSVVLLGLGGAGSGASAHAEARRLAASLQMASEEALVADRPIALSWDAEGYSFVVGSAGAWAAHTAPSLGERHALPDEISLAADSEAQPFPINENTSLSVTFSGGPQSWIVRFDGVGATIAEVPGG